MPVPTSTRRLVHLSGRFCWITILYSSCPVFISLSGSGLWWQPHHPPLAPLGEHLHPGLDGKGCPFSQSCFCLGVSWYLDMTNTMETSMNDSNQTSLNATSRHGGATAVLCGPLGCLSSFPRLQQAVYSHPSDGTEFRSCYAVMVMVRTLISW